MSARGKKRNRKGAQMAPEQYQTLEDVMKARLAAEANQSSQNDTVEDDEATPDDGMGVVETYSEYWPSKLSIGGKHPDPVVCTASLASVESPDITYELKLPENVIKEGLLSALQLEAVAYSCQAHEQHLQDEDVGSSRAGFLIGDGAGVGKGRTVAGIIFENHLQGRNKAVWISVSNDLKYDAQRDFDDIGARIKVYSLNKFQYNCSISSKANGKVTSGVIFCTYASLIGKSTNVGSYNTRLSQIVDWCGNNFDGCIVFDECHKAKNLIPVSSMNPTKTGQAVVRLQFLLPNARVVYSSATGASEPRNMAYMVRLGIWGEGTSFRTFQDFEKTVDRCGVGAMEIVAMDLKLRGMYVARQLSFQGVTFKVEKVPLTESFICMYDESVKLWIQAFNDFQEGIYLMGVPSTTSRTIWCQFWGAHQRFFKYLAIAAKVDHAVKLTQEAVAAGKCVVIGLQSTGEARTLDELDKCNGELEDYISTAKAVFQSLVEKQFPALDRSEAEVESKVEEPDLQTSTSRKRNPVKKFSFVKRPTRKRKMFGKKSRPQRHRKRPRIESSSSDEDLMKTFLKREDDNSSSSESEDSDSDDEYNPGNNIEDDVKVEPDDESMKSNVNLELGSDTSDDESSTSSEMKTPSESSDSDSGGGRKIKKSTSKISKVQEQLMKQYEEITKAKRANSGNDRDFQNEIIERSRDMKDVLLCKIEELGELLPKNTLDDLINKLGGSKKVAEMTGRKGRVTGFDDGSVQYESRSEVGVSLELLNIKEKERFMNGQKLIAIISEAASSGISLQSDRRVENQRRRLHITLELPWAADRAIQQFGRTHRSNQVNAPEYVFLISDLAGEQRFVATVARRLESLGALTHADRRATQTRDLSEFNIDNKYGRKALKAVMHAIAKLEDPMVPPPEDYEGDFFNDVHRALLDVDLDFKAIADEDRKSDNIVRFLNRSLGVPVIMQNYLFKYFSDTLHATIQKAKKEQKFDPGLMDLGNPERINRISLTRFFRKHATGISPVELHSVRVDRGLSWEEALEMSQKSKKAHEGFYIEQTSKMNKKKAILAIRLSDNDEQPAYRMMFGIYRPSTGLGATNESLAYIERTYGVTVAENAKDAWIHQYELSTTVCSHAFYSGKCTTSIYTDCDHGKRITDRVVLSGSLLGVWDRIEKQLRGGEDGSQSIQMKICRLRGNNGQANIIGTLVPNACVDELSCELGADAIRIESSPNNPAGTVLIPKSEPDADVEVKREVNEIEPKIESIELKAEPKIEEDSDVEFVC